MTAHHNAVNLEEAIVIIVIGTMVQNRVKLVTFNFFEKQSKKDKFTETVNNSKLQFSEKSRHPNLRRLELH